MRRMFALSAAALSAAFPAQGTTWNIFPDGSGDAPTIQAGIDVAAHHDTNPVHPGTHFEHIHVGGDRSV